MLGTPRISRTRKFEIARNRRVRVPADFSQSCEKPAELREIGVLRSPRISRTRNFHFARNRRATGEGGGAGKQMIQNVTHD